MLLVAASYPFSERAFEISSFTDVRLPECVDGPIFIFSDLHWNLHNINIKFL